MLSPTQIADYRRDGFLLLKSFASHDQCEAMRNQAANLVAQSGPVIDPRAVFDCQAKHNKLVSESYFLESTYGVKLYFDASAVAADGRMLRNNSGAIVKIGHALHDFDPVFMDYSHSSRMHDLAQGLGYALPLIGQSRYFFRLPHIQISVPPHQDSNMLYTEPLSCYAVWLALDDVTIENGCMWASPGSHLQGLSSRYVRNAKDNQGYLEKFRDIEIDESSYIPLEAERGTAVLMSGELFHKSYQNRSQQSRQSYVVHFIEGAASHKYPQENWLQRPGGFGQLRRLASA